MDFLDMDTKSPTLERLKKAITYVKREHGAQKLTNEEIGKKLEFSSKTYLSNLLHGHAPLNDKFLELLEQKLDISASWIRTGTGSMVIKKPKLVSLEERLYKLYEQKPQDLIKLIAFLFHRVASIESHYYGRPFHDQVEELVSAAEEFSLPDQ